MRRPGGSRAKILRHARLREVRGIPSISGLPARCTTVSRVQVPRDVTSLTLESRLLAMSSEVSVLASPSTPPIVAIRLFRKFSTRIAQHMPTGPILLSRLSDKSTRCKRGSICSPSHPVMWLQLARSCVTDCGKPTKFVSSLREMSTFRTRGRPGASSRKLVGTLVRPRPTSLTVSFPAPLSPPPLLQPVTFDVVLVHERTGELVQLDDAMPSRHGVATGTAPSECDSLAPSECDSLADLLHVVRTSALCARITVASASFGDVCSLSCSSSLTIPFVGCNNSIGLLCATSSTWRGRNCPHWLSVPSLSPVAAGDFTASKISRTPDPVRSTLHRRRDVARARKMTSRPLSVTRLAPRSTHRKLRALARAGANSAAPWSVI